MPKTISVIVIDIPSHVHTSSIDAAIYASLSAISKLSILVDHIDKIMRELERNEPDVLHVVTWREYGISGVNSKFVTLEEKNLIKKTLSDLAAKYPSLVIVSGTIACTKHFDNFSMEKFNVIENDYSHLQAQSDSDEQAAFHLRQLQAIKPGNKITVLEEDDSSDNDDVAAPATAVNGTIVVRNTCYVMQGVTIQRHDKTAPYIETIDYGGEPLKNAVFRPGKSTTKNPIINVIHPKTKEHVSLGIEICFEHQNKILKMIAKNHLLDLHLILSDFTRPKLQHSCSTHVVYVDSLHEPKMILTQEMADVDVVKFYSVNGLDHPALLQQSIDPLMPFELKISALIAAAIENCLPFHPDHDKLIDLKSSWEDVADQCVLKFQLSTNMKMMMDNLDQHIDSAKSNNIRNFYSLFYSESPAEKLLHELMKQYKVFIKDVSPADPHNYKDILSIRPADVKFAKEKKQNLRF